MKRLISFALALGVALALSGAVLAAAYETANDLYSAWEANGYPDYVSEVSSTSGGEALTVTLVAGFDNRADEVRALVTDQDSLSIVTGGTYSHNELMQANEQIVQDYLIDGNGDVFGCGVGWQTVDGKVVGFGESGTESRVMVDVQQGKEEEYAALFAERFGGMVVVEGASGVALTEDTALSVDGFEPAADAWLSPGLLALAALAVLALLTGALMLRARRGRVAQSANGAECTGTPWNRRTVRDTIRRSTPLTPTRGFDDLKKRL